MKNFLLNPWVLLVAIFIYMGFLGPYLMSAPSNIAVILNFACLFGLAFWAYVYTKSRIQQLATSAPPTNKE